ncbi:hypothetical protein CSC94_22155 [Zhengella mangrovi]|uniref:Antifreeze protein n=1 Tax=Zhengella mangrovi TaxID=1982044 RepID=A0A2G1QHE6_9HYPH|nr:hypothetical protein [Zhengella mangrovi]PHP64889.1 hypothetical protein CSC94_22150 [Zhengella mangrovi]PHP64890.1 hypothetical protein CSC94_22155 [Zhengella mangrovi]
MFKTIRTIALSTLVGLGTLAGASTMSATAADAASLSLGGPGGQIEIRFGGGRDHGWRDHRGFCSPRKALHKARRMGLHRAHVRFSNRRVIAVSGRTWDGRETMVFANTRHCPRIR